MIETKNIFDSTIKHLKFHYWGSIMILAIFFLLVLFQLIPQFFEGYGEEVTLERYSIVITIIAIPAALKLFAELLKKIPAESSIDLVICKYKRASYTRLYIINAVTLMNIVLYSVSRNMNFFWFTVVLFIVYIFCKPSYPELVNLAEKVEVSKVSADGVQEDIHNNTKINEADDKIEEL